MMLRSKVWQAVSRNYKIFSALAVSLILVSFLVSCTKNSDLSADTMPTINAIAGYDPVAYHTKSKPVSGSEDFFHVWNDAKWHFSCKENMELFKENPERYAPRYNGYCAFGLSRNDFVDADPEAWAIVNKKLYLTYNHEIRNAWLQDKRNYIAKADKNWHLRIEK
jgi:hypothetical protein